MKIALRIIPFFLLIPHLVFAGVEGHMTMTISGTKNASHTMHAKVFSEGNKFRMDMRPLMEGQGETSYIVDGDQQKSFSVMHSRKTYMKMPMNDEDQSNFFLKQENRNIEKMKEKGYQVKELSKEKIEGFTCTVYEMSGGPQHDLRTAKAWFADDLGGFMIKMDGKTKEQTQIAMTLTEIQKKKVPASMFQPPSNYKENQASPNMGDSSAMVQEMQRIQKLPPEERQKAMQQFQERMQKQAQGM